MKKKYIILSLVLLLSLSAFIAYYIIFFIPEKNKEYYFPQIETYIKMHNLPFDNYGHVIFSKDSISSFSDKVDFVEIYKSETSWINFIFNPVENNKIYIVDRYNNIVQINQVDFIFERIDQTDTLFFEKHIVAGTQTYLLKPPYIEISVDGYLKSVFFTNYYEEYQTKIEPLR